ncbi:hypothetical protein MKO06_12580 [Gramella sp. GC03-9]|uniref:Outer membrane protein beta-barrel domain-containing protein n=1 Tax=Christiangramia oceanisediminis TaxID=2920386 RepID=A0A9X2KYU3_9FLAO|nr:hypothetical protein [Gramella oceanisediminis]MCP9200749.1 hypothetical protein [Gramella oceanisediminis]
MRKLVLLIAIIGLGLTTASAQKNLTAALYAGVPVADTEDYSFHGSADIAYRVNVIGLLDVGGLIGYSHYFDDDVRSDFGLFDNGDLQYLPIAASARLNLLAILFVGTDLGYAVGLGNDGGFYFRPQVGVDLGLLSIVGNYEGISPDGGASVGSVNAGIEVRF